MPRNDSIWRGFTMVVAALVAVAVQSRDASAKVLGDVQSWKQEHNAVAFVCGEPVVRLVFWADDVVRVTLLPNGQPGQSGRQLVLEGCYGRAPSVKVADGDAVTLTTERMVVRVDKKPFRLRFFQADGVTPVARNPEGATLDTDLAAFLEPDASGKREHLFGGGGESSAACDLRGRSFICEDRPGYGCPAPIPPTLMWVC